MNYDEDKFNEIIDMSALKQDIDMLPQGVDTEIGEKGINLSGGQKARISFARSLYQNKDIYLLDDPLSAVDSHVGHTLFYSGIKKKLKNKTILLATHQVQYLKDCDLIVILDQGKILISGSYNDLKSTDIDIDSYITSTSNNNNNLVSNKIINTDNKGKREKNSIILPSTFKPLKDKDQTKDQAVVPLHTLEHKGVGSIRWDVYWFYINSGYPFLYIVIITICICAVILSNYSTLWLANWGMKSNNAEKNNTTLSNNQNLYYLRYYALFMMISSFASFVIVMINLENKIKVSEVIHSKLLSILTKSKVKYFDTTPQGRIMNFFSSDMSTIDQRVSFQLVISLTFSITMIMTIITLGYATKGSFFIILAPLLVLYKYFQNYFQKTMLELTRLNKIAKTPIISKYTETLYGISSIRAFNKEDQYEKNMEKVILHESTCYYLISLVNSWKSLRLDIIGASMSFFVYSLAALTSDFISVEMLLIAINYSQSLPLLCGSLVSIVSATERVMDSVERVMFQIINAEIEDDIYYESIDQSIFQSIDRPIDDEIDIKFEDKKHIENKQVLNKENIIVIEDDWPNNGVIKMNNIVIGYREGPDIINKLSFECKR